MIGEVLDRIGGIMNITNWRDDLAGWVGRTTSSGIIMAHEVEP